MGRAQPERQGIIRERLVPEGDREVRRAGGIRGLRVIRVPPDRKHAHDLLWGANDPEAMLPLDRPVIMGHQPRQAPLDTSEVIAIDTGAGTLEGGRLTAVLLPEDVRHGRSLTTLPIAMRHSASGKGASSSTVVHSQP